MESRLTVSDDKSIEAEGSLCDEVDAANSTAQQWMPSFETKKTPLLLRWSEGQLKTVASVSGGVTGLAVSVWAYALAAPHSVLGRLFNLGSAQGVLPVIMLCMFFWGLFFCLLRMIRISRAERISLLSWLTEIRFALDSVNLADLLSVLERTVLTEASPLLRRTRAVIRQWMVRPNLQDASVLLDHHVVSDEEVTRHAYTVIKTFVWALPVLGLIGTVLGISLAVGDFGRFIGTNVDDIAAIKSGLVHVTGGLSYAFTATLLGLLAALLLVLPASALQTREERLSTRVQQGIADILLPALQRSFPDVSDSQMIPDFEGIRKTLQLVAEDILSRTGETSYKIVQKAEHQVEAWATRLEGEMADGAQKLGAVVGKIGDDFATTSDEFLTRLSLTKDSLDLQAVTTQNSIRELTESASKTHTGLVIAVKTQQKTAELIGAQLAGFVDATKAILQAQNTLQDSLDNITRSGLDQRLLTLTETVGSVSGQTVAVTQALQSLSTTTAQTLDCQQNLQIAMQQLHQMGLSNTLSDFVQALQQVSQVLVRFQEPFVFQAVRVSPVEGRAEAMTGHAMKSDRVEKTA